MDIYRYIVSRYVHVFLYGPPLIITKVWQGAFFRPTSLFELGLCFYIDHQHTPCPSTAPFQQILVVDLNSAHYVNIQFCACKETPRWVEYYRQLLRVGWYPASFDRPKTAFTFDLLNTYHKLTLQGKINLFDFYMSIMQKTDNCGWDKPLVSHSMRAAVCRPTNVLPLSTGITTSLDAFASGATLNKSNAVVALTALNPLFPFRKGHLLWSVQRVPTPVEICQPTGIKPPTVQSIHHHSSHSLCRLITSHRWLYSLFLAVDANFRLKLKDQKIKDPEIGSGWAYFVENSRYVEHISQNTNDVEVCRFPHGGRRNSRSSQVTSCGSDFHAVNRANRKSTNYVTSGVVACVCARHSLMMKNGVGDLQRGERYVSACSVNTNVLTITQIH